MKETPLTKTEIEELEGAPIKEQRLTVSDVELGPLDELIYTPGGGGIVLREGDFGPPSIATDTFRRVSTPLSATKTLTEPTRSLLASPGSGIASEYLRSVDAPSSVQALIGLPADILQTGLGVLGTGFMGALSAPVEVAGLFMSPQSKRKLTRDVGGMVESIAGFGPTTLAGRVIGPSSAKRAIEQQPASVIAKEAQEIGVTPPATVLGPTTAGIAGAIEELPIVGGRLLDEPKRVQREIRDVARDKIPETGLDDFAVGAKTKAGAETFVNTTKAKRNELYDRADKAMPGDVKVEAENTVKFLESIADTWSGFASAAARTGDKQMLSLLKDLKKVTPTTKMFKSLEETGDVEAIAMLKTLGIDDVADLKPQKLEALRRLRTAVGEAAFEGGGGALADNINSKTLKDLYKVLSDDIDDAAAAYSPEAKRAYDRANRYNKARQKRIEGAIDDITKADEPERAYEEVVKIVTKGSGKDSQNALIKLQKSLGKDEFDEVSQTILSRMGKKELTPEGDIDFSPQQWIADYEKLTPFARRTLADSAGGKGTSKELDKLARYIKLTAEEASPSNYRFRRGLTQLGFFTTAATTGAVVGGVTGAALGTGMIAGVGLGVSQLLTNKSFLNALNKMAVGDTGPMRALANSKDLSAPSAKIAIQAYEED